MAAARGPLPVAASRAPTSCSPAPSRCSPSSAAARACVVLVEEDDARLGPAAEALAAAVERGRIRKLGIEKVNGEPVIGTPWEERLLELGFRAGPRKLTIGA